MVSSRTLRTFRQSPSNLNRAEMALLRANHSHPDVKDEFGHLYWDVETDHGFRKFVTRARDEGIYPIGGRRLLIVDMTGNRYEIEDYHRLDARSLRFLEPYI